MQAVWEFKDAMEARLQELKPFVEEYEEIELILSVITKKVDKATKEQGESCKKPSLGPDPLYKSVISYASHREKINQAKMRKFFNIGRERTKKLIAQMIKDGHIKEFDRSINGYPTNLVSKRKKYTITSEENKITVTTKAKA